MPRTTERRLTPLLLLSSLLAASAAPPPRVGARAVGLAGQQRGGAAARPQAEDKDKDEPRYHEYKGVRIGMTADEARKKLGEPADKGDKQDFYVFSDNETAQVFYDAEKKVYAVSVIYMGGVTNAPTAKSVLGTDLEAKPDGSMHRKVDYPKAGFWVAYSRTAGDQPLVTVTMQRKP
jgi:hypothetical protein